MTRLTTWMMVLLTGLIAWSASAQELVASIDRNRLSIDETLELTLEADGGVFGKPDLTPLRPLFEVLGTRQVNRLSTLQGQTRVVSRWIITLQPRRLGFVVIPPLTIGNLRSQPINIQVVDASGSDGELAPIFIDASLDAESIYVQAQALLTLRIYHSVSLYDDSSLTPLQVPDARVEQLGEPRTYEQIVNGVRHGVIELRYAIFPLKSGELTIPPQVFSATPVLRSSSAMPFGPRPGSPTRVRSPEIPLTVKPIPASYPAGEPWLPARRLTLTQVWSGSADALAVGDSLTRTLKIEAEGLASIQLPPLDSPALDGLRLYPDQPRLSDHKDEHGLIGSREESLALVPTRGGQFEVPTQVVYWWNTATDQLERAELPSRTLAVADDPALDEPASSGANGAPVMASEPVLLWPWQLSTLILALTTLTGFGLWWRARRLPAVIPTATSGPSPRTLLDEIRRACQANDPQASRQALDAWARQHPETLAQMAARYAPLSEALDGLNGALYSETGQQWEGEALWQAIRSLPPRPSEHAEADTGSPLPPLYPR